MDWVVSARDIYSLCTSAVQLLTDWVGAGGERVPAEKAASARDAFLTLRFRHFSSHGLDRWWERDAGVSLFSAAALLVCIAEDRESQRVGHSYLVRFRRFAFKG